MTLHFSQIGFTDDLTFIVIPLSNNEFEQSCRIILTKASLIVKCFLNLIVRITYTALFVSPDDPAL